MQPRGKERGMNTLEHIVINISEISLTMSCEDIYEALRFCAIEKKCTRCPLFSITDCDAVLIPAVFEMVKRQKAEIERLQKYNTDMARKHYNDGIKEFAEKLKADMFYKCGDINYTETSEARKLIDNLVKEMTGEQE